MRPIEGFLIGAASLDACLHVQCMNGRQSGHGHLRASFEFDEGRFKVESARYESDRTATSLEETFTAL